MSIVGTLEVVTDTRKGAIVIRSTDADDPFLTEEVIDYLESTGLATRTRKKIDQIFAAASEKGAEVRVFFKGAWNYLWELDVVYALKALLARRGIPCA